MQACWRITGLERGSWRSHGTRPHWPVESVASGTWGPATGQLGVWYQPAALRTAASSFVHSGSRTYTRYLRVLRRAPQEVPQISCDPFPGLHPSSQLGNVSTLVSLQLAHVTAQHPAGPLVCLLGEGNGLGQAFAAEVLVGTGTAETSVRSKEPQFAKLLMLGSHILVHH